jgi:hypothetical protein
VPPPAPAPAPPAPAPYRERGNSKGTASSALGGSGKPGAAAAEHKKSAPPAAAAAAAAAADRSGRVSPTVLDDDSHHALGASKGPLAPPKIVLPTLSGAAKGGANGGDTPIPGGYVHDVD